MKLKSVTKIRDRLGFWKAKLKEETKAKEKEKIKVRIAELNWVLGG